MKRARRKETGAGAKAAAGDRTARRSSQNGRASAQNGQGRSRPFSLASLLADVRKRDLVELYRFWEGGAGSRPPDSEETLRRRLKKWMKDPERIEDRVAALGSDQCALLEALLSAPEYRRSWKELTKNGALVTLSEYDLEAGIAALGRRGLVLDGDDPRFDRYGERVLAIPVEVGDGLVARRREKGRGLFGTLTLRGHLEEVYTDPARAKRMTPQRLRELYKMYSQETASTARIDRLPDGVRGLVEKAILEFGGILPRQLFERMDTELPHWNGRRWRMILEQSLVGTVRELDLSRYGIQLKDETLVVFNEVALAWLRRVAVPGDPDRPHEELSLGIDLISNISRFLAYIDDNGVRFTVRGEIFKTTEKKIVGHLIPNPGRELSREEVLSYIFRFAKKVGLIDRTGKRTFKVTTAGREWSGRPLLDKQRMLLDFAMEERQESGVLFHQVRMRKLLLKMLKRIEAGVWYDLMYLPFLARNTYLSSLDDLRVDEHFTERSQNGRFPAMEDPQRLAWNLVKWARQRLYLAGVIDLGYDKSRRPVAMRLTQTGARLLELERIGPVAPNRVGSLVVTPDFEVVLFPTGDDAELIHDLDRFCTREKLGSLFHFRISQEGVVRALKGGMGLEDLGRVLELHSRTPVPQNVSFSLRDWALRAGLMRLDKDLVLACEEPEVQRRFLQDPGTRKYVARVIDERLVQLGGRTTPRRMAALLRDLGYLVELGPPVE